MKIPFATVFEKPLVTPLANAIDKKLTGLLTKPDFLRTASLVINLNSYRRKWTRAAVRRALMTLELPVRSDQEKMLVLLEQLGERIEDLEAAAQTSSLNQASEPLTRKKKLDVVGRLHVPS